MSVGRTTLSLAAYRPRGAAEDVLVAHFRAEVTLLRSHDHITARPAPMCRTPAGDYLVLIEWSRPAAVDDAHADAEILAIWARKAQLVDYIGPRELDGSETPFVSYEVIADL